MTKRKFMVAGASLALLGPVAGTAQPRDGEQPAFVVIADQGQFQVRDYDAIVVAEVTHHGTRREASGQSFRRLAAYIFGHDRPDGGEKIAMTSPVIHERVTSIDPTAMNSSVIEEKVGKGPWRMRFVMPAKYTLETLPEAPKDITLTEVPARRMATVTFSGYASQEDIKTMEGLLLDWIKREKLTMIGEAEYAFYDAPMVPGRFRRNEVMIQIAP